MYNSRSTCVAALIASALVLGACANRDAKRQLSGGYTRMGNEAVLDAQDQQKRKQDVENAKVAADEDRKAIDGMLQASQATSSQLDVQLARMNSQNKGTARERAALSAELADIKKQTAAIPRPRPNAEVSPEELARSRKKLEDLTARRKTLADQLDRAVKN